MLSFFSRLSAFQRVLTGLVLGIFAGLFVGEPAGNLEFIGNAYVRLLQMTVLPYLLMSVIGGLGKLEAGTAAKIGIRAGLLVLFLWLATMLTNLLLPLAYPNWEAANFFSTSLTTEQESFDFLQLYIPSNIFFSLSNAVVPSVVLFSLLFGSALIKVKDKDVFLQVVTNLGDTLMKMASYVAKLAPYGIFAISAAAAGTLQTEDIGRLQVFLWAYLAMWVLMAFVALPLFISWATPIKYRDVSKMASEAMVTAFATGTVLVVLPMIAERCKELLKSYNMDSEETDAVVDVMVPTAYSFPSVGTLMGLGFILFSGWYLGSPISLGQYPSYVMMGTFTAFGSMPVAIPFMLDYFQLPADQFQLYLLGSVVTARFATAMAALHGFIICILVASAMLNRLRWRRLFSALGVHLGIAMVAMTGLGFILTTVLEYQYTEGKSFESMQLMGTPALVQEADLEALHASQLAMSRLDVILQRGSLRVGYFADDLPYTYRNSRGEVIGFDMDLVHALANDLEIDLEIHRVVSDEATKMLNDGRLDMLVGGFAITPGRALEMAFSIPYIQHTLGLIVSDDRREEFSSLANIQKMAELNLALPDISYYRQTVEKVFANAEITDVVTPRTFFRGELPDVDAMVYPVESGSAWTLLYPNYSVVLPTGLRMKAPAGLVMPLGENNFVQFVNTWLLLKEGNNFRAEIYSYWILGQDPKAIQPRWSIMKDVLHWTQ